jgi:ankyrin repeat protein
MNRFSFIGQTPLINAIYLSLEDMVTLLLAQDHIDMNAKDVHHSMTLLLQAATMGHEGMIRILLEKEGVDKNMVNNKGEMAILCAITHGHGEMAKLLLKHE